MKIYINTRNSIIIKKRRFVLNRLSSITIHKIILFIFIRNVNDKMIKFDKFVIINLFFDNFTQNASFIKIITIEIHFINNFVVNLLFDNNILIF